MKKNWIKITVLAVLGCLCVKYSDTVFDKIALLAGAVAPLLYGFMIAYVLNILMKGLEKLCFPKRQDARAQRVRRGLCVFGSIFLVLLLMIVLLLLVIPALRDAVLVLTKDIPRSFANFQDWASALAAKYGYVEVQDFVDSLKIDWNTVFNRLSSLLSSGVSGLFNSAFSVANLIVSFVFTGLISLIFSIYMLFQKETLSRQLKKAGSVYLPQRWRETGGALCRLAHETFTNFITGQLTEAVILGSLCAGGMFLLRLPYALMVGVIVGVSALIPVMGAYIGAFVGAFLILTVSPVKALGFLIYLAILQQLEGNLIYPRVVGGSIGLPGIWVLAAVTVSGGLFGVPGMLVGVPLTATMYKWIRSDVNRRVRDKIVPREPHLFEEAERKVALKK